jgi:hypothetical protein
MKCKQAMIDQNGQCVISIWAIQEGCQHTDAIEPLRRLRVDNPYLISWNLLWW